MFVPEAQIQVINLLNDTAKTRQKVKLFLFMYPASWCLFEVIWLDSLIIFKIIIILKMIGELMIIINFNEFINIYLPRPIDALRKLD